MRQQATSFILVCTFGVLPGCAATHPTPSSDVEAPQPLTVRVHLPQSLEPQRGELEAKIKVSVHKAVEWFAEYGFDVPTSEVLTDAYFFDVRESGRAHLARHFGIEPKDVPRNFSAGADGTTVWSFTPALYRESFERLYPDQTWSKLEHGKLLVHEITHAIHARIARDHFGTEDAMGPRWFFEGLAVVCAGQFLPDCSQQKALSWDQIAEYIAQDAANTLPIPTYPVYAKILRTLQERIPMAWMIEHAGDIDFNENLQYKYFQSLETK